MEVPKILYPFTCHGVEFNDTSGDEWVGSCPFCMALDHFYTNGETGQYQCKKCNSSGNVITFLTKYIEQQRSGTRKSAMSKLGKERSISLRALLRYKTASNGTEWLFPCINTQGNVVDIRRWRDGKTRGTKGCANQLYGLHLLKRNTERVWLCEGEWDALALSAVIPDGEVALAVPGADVFKAGWVDHFAGKHITICYDNDEAGDRGSMKAGTCVTQVARSVRYLCWPEDRSVGWDVRDHLSGGGTFLEMQELILPSHRRAMDAKQAAAEKVIDGANVFETKLREECLTFNEVVTVFRQHMHMDRDMIDTLRYMMAVCVSEQLQGSPLWSYIVAPAGGGKTVLLSSLRGSDRTVFRSSIGPHALISGFKGPTDPGLLSWIGGYILICKDGTELFNQSYTDRQLFRSIMTGAFDGYVQREYGNGVHREYNDLHFTVLIGITPMVHGFSDATMGERFLKFNACRAKGHNHEEARMRAAVASMDNRQEHEAAVGDAAVDFLKFKLSHVPTLPDWFCDRTVPLATLVGMLRAVVERRAYTDELLYQPRAEYATRLFEQLSKLAKSYAIVMQTEVTEKIYSWVRNVAMDTANEFHLRIVRHIAKLTFHGKRMKGVSAKQLEENLGIPHSTLVRRLPDMALLKVLEAIPAEDENSLSPGRRTRVIYRLTGRVGDLVRRAKL